MVLRLLLRNTRPLVPALSVMTLSWIQLSLVRSSSNALYPVTPRGLLTRISLRRASTCALAVTLTALCPLPTSNPTMLPVSSALSSTSSTTMPLAAIPVRRFSTTETDPPVTCRPRSLASMVLRSIHPSVVSAMFTPSRSPSRLLSATTIRAERTTFTPVEIRSPVTWKVFPSIRAPAALANPTEVRLYPNVVPVTRAPFSVAPAPTIDTPVVNSEIRKLVTTTFSGRSSRMATPAVLGSLGSTRRRISCSLPSSVTSGASGAKQASSSPRVEFRSTMSR